MAINYDITGNKLRLSVEIDASMSRTDVDLDIATMLGVVLASGYGQLLFGAINWVGISTFPWMRDNGPKIAEKYNYSILGDESYQEYCNLMTAVDKVAKYPRKDAQSAEQPTTGDEVVTSEALLYTNYVFGKVAGKLSEFCNSGKTEVRLGEIKDIMDEVNELFKSFKNPDPELLAWLQADAQDQSDNVPAQVTAAPAAPAAAQQNQAAAAVGNNNFDNISRIVQQAALPGVN